MDHIYGSHIWFTYIDHIRVRYMVQRLRQPLEGGEGISQKRTVADDFFSSCLEDNKSVEDNKSHESIMCANLE